MTFRLRPRPLLAAFVALLAVATPAIAQDSTPSPTTAETTDAAPDTVAEQSSVGGPDPTVEEILVSGTSVTSAVDQARFSESMVDVLSAEDFAVTGDSNVVDALSRVTGVTTVGDKYVYVRGLGERYSSILFNNAALPSPDPFRRVVPLDLFPSGVMEQLTVQKTFAPSIPGDFAGGSVQLTTRAVPAEREANMSVSMGVNTETTGRTTPWYEGSGSDWTGFDGNYRDLPSMARNLDGTTTPADRQTAGLAVNRSWEVDDQWLPPDFGLGLSYANRVRSRVGDFGFVFGGGADNEWRYRKEERATGVSAETSRNAQTVRRTKNSIQYSGLGSVDWTPAKSQRVRATVFSTHLTDKRYQDIDPAVDTENDQVFHLLRSDWEERGLVSAQLEGAHSFDSFYNLGIDWGATFAQATRERPDARLYRFQKLEEGGEVLATQFNNERTWEDLTDDVWDTNLSFSLPVRVSDWIFSTFKTGTRYYNKQRDSELTRFRYFTTRPISEWNRLPIDEVWADENIRPDHWRLQEFSRDTDQYTAEEEIFAGFLQAETEIGESLRWMLGVRYESSTQTTETGGSVDAVTELKDDRPFPATQLTWSVREDIQVRAAFSQTLNRPDLRELSGSIVENPEENRLYFGNPDLEVAELLNYDLSIEWYHGASDSVEVAAFYKDITNPIEVEHKLIGDIRTYLNADSAYLYGLEAAFKQSLEPIGRWADDFSVRGNAAWIKSEATVPSDSSITNKKHPLQGQSDWIVNMQITHDYLPWDLTSTLAFNMAGERLKDLGSLGRVDAYEQPRAMLDFIVQYGFDLFGEDMGLTFKAKNLLDAPYEEKRGQVTEFKYHEGREFSLEISKDF